jgi:hypothetical protein
MSIVHLSDSSTQAGVIQAGAGIAVDFTIDAQDNNFVVTAVSADSGSLKLIAWELSNGGKRMARVGDSGSQGPAASLVAIARATQNRFISAVRTTGGVLQLIAWNLDIATGKIARLSDSGNSEGEVGLIAMAQSPLGDGHVLVALANAAGNLVLQNWRLDDELRVEKVGDTGGEAAGAVSRIALGTVGQHAFTAVRTASGALEVIVWAVQTTGGLKRLGDSGKQAGAIGLVDAVSLKDLIVTAVRDGGGNLKLISWKVSPDGMTVTRAGDSGPTKVMADQLACAGLPLDGLFSGTAGRVLTTVRNPSSKQFDPPPEALKLTAWEVATAGAVTRVEDFDDRAGTVDVVTLRGITGSYLSAVRNADDQRLHLDAWRLDTFAPPQGLPDNLVVSGQADWESTAQVIAPMPAVPRGRIAVMLGESQAGPASFSARDLLDPTATTFALTAPETLTPYPLDPSKQAPAVDNQLIRLQDGSLLSTKNGYVWGGLASPPAWINDGVPKTVSGGFTPLPPNARNAVLVFRSTDGLNWALWSVVDSAVVANGKYSWPQTAKTSLPGQFHAGGFDRTEVYQDPWTGDIYLTGKADGGPYPTFMNPKVSNHAGVLLVSKDNGKTWGTLHEFTTGDGAPFVMTSTPNHPLVLFDLIDDVPMLYWLEKGGSTLVGGKQVAVIENGSPVKAAGDKGISDLVAAPPYIARITTQKGSGRDRVWTAYATLNPAGREVYKLSVVTFGGGQDPTTELLTTIQATNPAANAVALGGFVQQDDPVKPAIANPDNLTMFYWVDAPPKSSKPGQPANGLFVRFKMLFGVSGHYQSGDLSVTGGVRRVFDRLPMGDYFKGGYFEWNGKLHFFLPWREPDALKGNIVSMTP